MFVSFLFSAMSVSAKNPVDPVNPSVLILGRTFFNGDLNIDRTFRKKLEAEGFEIGFGLHQELTWDMIRRFDMVVMLAQPLPGTAEFNELQSRLPVLQRYLSEGGGLFILRDQTSGGAGDTVILNEILQPWGASMRESNLVSDTAPENTYWWDFQLRAFRGETVKSKHPILEGVKEAWYPAHTVNLEVDENWTPLLTGAETSITKDKTTKSPLLMAARETGRGRIVVLPSVSSYSVLDGYSAKWDGYIFKTGDGERLFLNVFDWLARNPKAGKDIGGFVKAQQKEIFDLKRLQEFNVVRSVPLAEQGDYGRPYRCLIGPRISPDDVAAFAVRAKEKGYSVVIVVTEDASVLPKLAEACDAASDSNFVVAAGLEATDPRGDRGIFLGGSLIQAGWPPPGWKDKSFLAASVGAGAMTIMLKDSSEKWPISILGAVSSLEVKGYASNGSQVADSESLYRKLNRYDWFQTPAVVRRLQSVDDLNSIKGFDFYVYAHSLSELARGLKASSNVGLTKASRFTPFSQRLFASFISDGPIMTEFFWKGKGLSYDLWEGEYYMWPNGDDIAEIHIAVSSTSLITQVQLWEDEQLIRSFRPNTNEFKTVVKKRCDHASRNYLVEVLDASGKRAISSVLRSRSREYWAHGGADRMQTYSNLFFPGERGFWDIHGETQSFVASTYFDTGWGNTFEKAMPPIESEKFDTKGIETGGPKGGLAKLLYPPFLAYAVEQEGGTFHSTMADVGRYGYEITSGDCAILDDSELRKVIKRKPVPITILDAKLFDLSTRYTIYRFAKGTFETVLMETTLRRKSGTWQAGEKIPAFDLSFKNGSREILKSLITTGDDGKVRRAPVDLSRKTGKEVVAKLGRGGFAGFFHDPKCGNGAVYVLDDNSYETSVDFAKPGIGLSLLISDATQTEVKTRLAIVYTASEEPEDGSYFEQIAKFLESPELSLTVEKGQMTHKGYPVKMSSEDGGVILKLSPAGSPQLLPVEVAGLNSKITSGIIDLETGAVKIISGLSDRIFLSLDCSKASRIYAGNLVKSESSDLVIDLLTIQPDGSLKCSVHNVSSQLIESTLSHALGGKAVAVRLEPGETQEIDLTVH